MSRKAWIFAVVALATSVPLRAQPLKIGTFDKASIVVAYYRSPMFSDLLKAKKAEKLRATAAKDTKKVEELERWGSASQERAHQQLGGNAPIDEIVDALKPAFVEAAKKAQVVAIAVDLPYAEASVQTADVTDLLLDWLKADASTRAIVKDLRQRSRPLPAVH
jgi:hypothetical protein